MKTNEREKMVKAMEFIMRQVNDECRQSIRWFVL